MPTVAENINEVVNNDKQFYVIEASGAAMAVLLATIDADTGAIKTAVEILDNAISGTEMQVDVVGALPAGTASVGATTDDGPKWTTTMGLASQARFTSADQSGADADVTAAPTGSQKLVITDIVVSVDTAMRVDFKEETAGTVFLSLYLAANGSAQITPRSIFKLNTADKKLQVRTSASGNIAVTVWHYSEA